MNDQATTLRNMAAQTTHYPSSLSPAGQSSTAQPANSFRTRSIAITGGKGGVGKSVVSVNLALELAALKRRVTLLDADYALANADVLLGLNPQFHLGHVLKGQCALEDIVLEASRGVRLIPGGSGIEEVSNLSLNQNSKLVAELCAMEISSDFMVIDTAAGISPNVIGVLCAASEVIVVITPDPTSMVDAYATIKVLQAHGSTKPIAIIVNNVIGIGDAEQTFRQLNKATTQFLKLPLEFLGSIPHDQQLIDAVRHQVPVVEQSPQAPASRALRLIAGQIVKQFHPADGPPMTSFWTNLTDEA